MKPCYVSVSNIVQHCQRYFCEQCASDLEHFSLADMEVDAPVLYKVCRKSLIRTPKIMMFIEILLCIKWKVICF